mmetsp:Transcript_35302/g.76628  ORF Transcript_35302/g.76628 Transcript_35302/m.76628 type:complete len:256 (+) Transcript_35302:583-1350(+)
MVEPLIDPVPPPLLGVLVAGGLEGEVGVGAVGPLGAAGRGAVGAVRPLAVGGLGASCRAGVASLPGRGLPFAPLGLLVALGLLEARRGRRLLLRRELLDLLHLLHLLQVDLHLLERRGRHPREGRHAQRLKGRPGARPVQLAHRRPPLGEARRVRTRVYRGVDRQRGGHEARRRHHVPSRRRHHSQRPHETRSRVHNGHVLAIRNYGCCLSTVRPVPKVNWRSLPPSCDDVHTHTHTHTPTTTTTTTKRPRPRRE